MIFGTEKDDFLEDPGSWRTNESEGRNSQPKMCRMAPGKQHHFGISFLKSPGYELNLNIEDREEVFFGSFYDGPGFEVIGSEFGDESYCKRTLGLSHELNKRQCCVPRNECEEGSIPQKLSKPVNIWDANLVINVGCKKYDPDASLHVTESTRDFYDNPKIFKQKTSHNTAISQDQNTSHETYDAVTGTMLPLRLKDVEKKLESSSIFPLADGGNYLLGEPLKDIISDTSGMNRVTEPLLIDYNHKGNLLLIGNYDNYDKENVIDPRVIFKFEANTSYPRGVKKAYNNRLSDPLTQANNTTFAFLDTNKSAKLDTTVSKKVSLITDRNIFSPAKKTIMLTYPTPDPLPEKESGTHIYNKGGHCTNSIIEYDQKEVRKIDRTKAAAKNKPKISQKLLYIHNLSRSSNTKIDETVAYLHYKLRSYENMAVLTRIRNILQSHQLNLIGICGQLGIPELLVPRRTN